MVMGKGGISNDRIHQNTKKFGGVERKKRGGRSAAFGSSKESGNQRGAGRKRLRKSVWDKELFWVLEKGNSGEVLMGKKGKTGDLLN